MMNHLTNNRSSEENRRSVMQRFSWKATTTCERRLVPVEGRAACGAEAGPPVPGGRVGGWGRPHGPGCRSCIFLAAFPRPPAHPATRSDGRNLSIQMRFLFLPLQNEAPSRIPRPNPLSQTYKVRRVSVLCFR